MSEPAASRRNADLPQRWAPPTPSSSIVPGVVLLFVGLWMLFDQGPVALGAACVAIGQALLLVGAVAKGVVWGLDLQQNARR